MKLSELVKSGVQNKPPRILLHGIHGIGKSTWAAGAPNPIFLPTEDGLTTIDVPHFPVAKTLDEFFSYLGTLIKEDHQYSTVVVDTVDWLQTLIWAKVCEDAGVDSIEQIGYAKGYIFALKHWDRFLSGVEKLRGKKGMAIVLLAHNEIKTFNPPDGDAYDRFQIKLHKHAATKLEEWADCVLFANFDVYTQGEKGDKKVVNNNPGRVIHTANRPAWRAKTRYKLPEQLSMDFKELLDGIKGKR